MEYDEYLLLIKQLGKRPDKSVEVRDLKGAIAMVTQDKEYISALTQMLRLATAPPLAGDQLRLWMSAARESPCFEPTLCLSQTSTR